MKYHIFGFALLKYQVKIWLNLDSSNCRLQWKIMHYTVFQLFKSNLPVQTIFYTLEMSAFKGVTKCRKALGYTYVYS